MAETIVGALVGLVIALVLIIIFTFIFRWLWNSTLPEVFGVKTLTLWQALKILILAGILFGGHRVVVTNPSPVDLFDAAEPAAEATTPAPAPQGN